jgi:hypothetical protein
MHDSDNEILGNIASLHRYGLQDSQRIFNFLKKQGTFSFVHLHNGLFPAASASSSSNTGYAYVWVRDNIYVAYAHYIYGQIDVAVRTATVLMSYFEKFRVRFEGIIDKSVSPDIVSNRPNIRFDGQTLTEVDEVWEHAQNDALGYFLWFYCKLVSENHIHLQSSDCEILSLFPLYFQSIQYWEDEDSGHWEEERKIEASSIGVVVAGLKEFKNLLDSFSFKPSFDDDTAESITVEFIDELIERGENALNSILPCECKFPEEKARECDSALLFLIYPLEIVDEETAENILQNVISNLQGEYGIRRYLKDSFWCRDFFTDIPLDIQTATYTNREKWLDENNRSVDGDEAQWCIFDPIISCIFGLRFRQRRDKADLDKQIYYLKRALSQITRESITLGDYQIEKFMCPELYFLQNGRYIPNVSTPLLWAQANLMIAMKSMEESLTL